MSKSLAKIWARKIYSGDKTVVELINRYGDAGYQAVKVAYFELYGEDLENNE